MFHFILSPLMWLTPGDDGTVYQCNFHETDKDGNEIHIVTWSSRKGERAGVAYYKTEVDKALREGIWIKTDEYGN